MVLCVVCNTEDLKSKIMFCFFALKGKMYPLEYKTDAGSCCKIFNLKKQTTKQN